MRVPDKKYVDNLSRFRNEVMNLTGIKKNKKAFNAPVTRKEKRKISRKLKHAKNLAFTKKEKVKSSLKTWLLYYYSFLICSLLQGTNSRRFYDII